MGPASVRSLLGGASALALAVTALPALAQDQAEDTTVSEVVVTAQFREQNLQEVPLAITAVGGEDLAERNLTNLSQISSTAPNVNLSQGASAFGNITAAAIRGIGQADFNYAFEPGVGMYIDDVYYGTMFGTVFDLLDLDRVEVLRGPQGTLFGKNTIGGAIRMIPKKPTGNGGGFVEITGGKYDRIDVRGAFDFTLVPDKLFVRISGVSKQRDGFQKAIDFACRFPAQAGTIKPITSASDCVFDRYGGEDVRAGRLAIRWIASETVEVNLAFDKLKDESPIQADSLLAVDTGDPGGIYLAGGGRVPYSQISGSNAALVGFWNQRVNIPTYGVPWDQRFINPNIYESYATYRTFDGIEGPRERTVDAWGFAGTIDWDIAENLNLKSITGYRTYDGNISHDPDVSPLSIQVANSYPGSEQWTQEVRLSGEAFANKLEWTVGAFYYDVESTLEGPVVIDLFGADAAPYGAGCPGSPATCAPLPPLRFGQNDTITATSKSAFVHGIYHVNDALALTLGYRYSDEKKTYVFDHSLPVPGVPASGFFKSTAPAVSEGTRSDFRVALDYKVSEDVLVYGQVATGYRSGGINPRPFSPPQLIPFGPEKVVAYELGAKTDWFDNRLRANLAVFYTDYKDRIINTQTIDALGAPLTAPVNIGTAKVKGIELEVQARPTPALRIEASLGIIDMKLGREPGATNPNFIDAAATVPTGSIFAGVPETTASIGAAYEFDLGGAGTLTPRLDYVYRSRVYGDAANTELASVDPYNLWSGRLTWVSEDADWSVALSVTNLTDKKYFLNKFSLLSFGLGTLEGQPAPPREWAVTVRRNF